MADDGGLDRAGKPFLDRSRVDSLSSLDTVGGILSVKALLERYMDSRAVMLPMVVGMLPLSLLFTICKI